MSSPKPRAEKEKQDNWPYTCGCRVQRNADVGLMQMDLIVYCRLHEAAPQMLEALKGVLKDQTDDMDWTTLEAVKKAIAASREDK